MEALQGVKAALLGDGRHSVIAVAQEHLGLLDPGADDLRVQRPAEPAAGGAPKASPRRERAQGLGWRRGKRRAMLRFSSF